MNRQELTYELDPDATAVSAAADRQFVSPAITEFRNIELQSKIANLETRCLTAEAQNEVLRLQLDKVIQRNEVLAAKVAHYETIIHRTKSVRPHAEIIG